MMSYKVILTKIESTHNNLRTTTVEGNTLDLPSVGKGFYLVGQSLTEGIPFRMIQTTEIKEVEQNGDNEYVFKTLNSTYKLEVLGTEKVD